MNDNLKKFNFDSANLPHSSIYNLPIVFRILSKAHQKNKKNKLFDSGCGNGSVTNCLSQLGFDCTGVDVSESGINLARKFFPQINFFVDDVNSDLALKFGKFSIVTSFEVLPYIFNPQKYIKNLYNLLESNGTIIVITPFHGFYKSLFLLLTGKFSSHYHTLSYQDPIHFFTPKSLNELFFHAGFTNTQIYFSGNFAPFHKSMIIVAHKNAK
jgi:2-polyprenyl-3-methyl-5-hydroxy-6-metoxy-1,4-benzoquinol methylase